MAASSSEDEKLLSPFCPRTCPDSRTYLSSPPSPSLPLIDKLTDKNNPPPPPPPLKPSKRSVLWQWRLKQQAEPEPERKRVR
ncbi:hypothetical protein C1H46_003271 [Malus baccata]|uniref:Uncharacterized protein n=1 Tax=Malus baccata TaxID=106549 RepID=A0A540NJR9_MALBA|nr:hypothetical protein C1H46_003271 [Malus baccata]